VEFVERLEANHAEERWLVRGDGAEVPHVAWFFADDDRDMLAQTESATRPYHGTIHPRVSTILGTGWHGERLVVEVDDDRGPTLAAAARQLTDPVERERWVIAQFIALADGLAALRGRARDFVHRQLEPHKMFVDVQGHAMLRAPIAYAVQGPRPHRTGVGVIRGTPGFMSPEQARGVKPRPASDVFALASNLYFVLTGRRPFANDSMMDELTAIIQEPAPALQLHTPGVAAILARAFAKDPAARIPDPGSLAGELWQCVPDAAEYDAVISDRIVAWRAEAPSGPPTEQMFDAKCRMRWEQLAPTTHADVRHCAGCHQDVVRVRSIAAIVPLHGRSCVAYTGGS